MIKECLKSKIITSSGKLQPFIYTSIFELYCQGEIKVSANMVRDKCNSLNPKTPWAGRIPAICNSMRNVLDCGASIISDDRDFGDFTIMFSDLNQLENKNVSSDIDSQKTEIIPFVKNVSNNKISLNDFVKEKFQNENWEKLKHKKKIKLLIIGCSNKKNDGGIEENLNNYFNQNIFQELIEAKLERYNQYEGFLIDNSIENGEQYLDFIQNPLYLPAFERYNGPFYSNELRNLYQLKHDESNLQILILSGLYGVIDFRDSIIDYNLRIDFDNFWTNNNIISSVIQDYIQLNNIDNEDVYYSLSAPYQELLNVNNQWTNLWQVYGRSASIRASARFLTEFLNMI